MQAGLADRARFAAEIRRDRYRSTPGRPAADRPARQGRPARVRRELREGRGPGVVLLAAGRCGARRGDEAAAGRRLLGSQSGWLTSSTFGGISWLAHSTLQSGVWVDSPTRYDELVGSDRLTLSQAFRRAGWRAVDDVPSNNRYWPDGVVVLPLRQGLRPARTSGIAAPPTPTPRCPTSTSCWPCSASSSRSTDRRPALRRGRPGVEPRAVDPDPAADRLERRRRRLGLLQAAGRHDRPAATPSRGTAGRSSTR